MKLSGAQATRFFARPDADRAGALIYGADAMRVALRRQEFIATLLGPAGEAEMRLTRISGGDLRRDPAEVTDAIRAQGFFPGLRVVFVEDAGDAAAPALTAALQDWRAGDAVLVVTAGSLGKASALKRAFDAKELLNPGKVIPTPRLCGEVPGPYRAHPLERLGLAERF